MNKVLFTIGIIPSICLASTESAGSDTVASKPKTKPKVIIKNKLLYLANEPPTIRPIGKILVSRPTINKA